MYGLNPRTKATITDRKKLFAEFEQIRASGVACDREESIRGGICFGAAVQPSDRPVVAAISLSTPTTRMDPVREKEIEAAVLEAARALAKRL